MQGEDGGQFVAGGALEQDNPAFATDLFRPSAEMIGATGLARFAPQVVAGTHACGASSFARWIAAQHQALGAGPVNVAEVRAGRGVSRDSLKATLADKLSASRDTPLLHDIWKERGEDSSREPLERSVLIVDLSDDGEDDTIRWLLSNVHDLAHSGEILKRARVQILLTGAFSLETLSGGPTSDYPLPSLQVPEFTESLMRSFVSVRFARAGIGIDDGVLDAIWRYTEGDKYLVQWFGQSVLVERPGAVTVSLISRLVQRFAASGPEAPGLPGAIARAAPQVLGGGEFEGTRDWMNGQRKWRHLGLKTRRTLFRSGIAIKAGSDKYSVRCPLVGWSMDYRSNRRVFLMRGTLVSISGRSPARLVELLSQLEEQVLTGAMAWFGVGIGKCAAGRFIGSVQYDNGASEEGEWEVSVDEHQNGEPFQAVLVRWAGVISGGEERVFSACVRWGGEVQTQGEAWGGA